MARPEDKTVLVVDDEEDVREYFAMALEDAGFNVLRAANGNEALERIREKTPDFISLDLVMPEKSGIRLLRATSEQRVEEDSLRGGHGPRAR
jgi:CheY-like chemotaxis protein